MGKIVITGTGRCGTSFLVHLFTALEFNTGYTLEECIWHLKRSKCDGGIEHSIGTELFKKSDIVKNPLWMYDPEVLDFDIDYLIVPFRKLENVALSRERNNGYGGFLKGANDINSQMDMDAKAFYKFMEYIIKKDLKVIFLDFPRIVEDINYLHEKLFDLLGKYGHVSKWSMFSKVVHEIADIKKVHIY
ncbi:MAG: hypothetical protein IIC75_06320, partial [Bacteroidetes bacterium]|nr:hypothetical protein [Bacteroidota bacterium]